MLVWLLAIIVTATPVLCAAAYAIGRYCGHGVTIPWRPILQLVDHRQRCLGQDEQRIRGELAAVLPVGASAWEDLLAMRRSPERPGERTA